MSRYSGGFDRRFISENFPIYLPVTYPSSITLPGPHERLRAKKLPAFQLSRTLIGGFWQIKAMFSSSAGH